MEIKYVLKGGDNNVSPFVGHVKIKLMPYVERLKLIKEMNLQYETDGTVSKNNDNISVMQILAKVAHSQVTEVDLLHVESEHKFTSLEELEIYDVGASAISEIGSVILNGLKLGKN